MTGLLSLRPLALLTALLAVLLSLASPPWLRLAGIGPAWSVLWLLPWALAEGIGSALVGAVGLALVLDGLHPAPVSLLPGLVLLAWWWGRLGRCQDPIQQGFSLGLLALLGTALLDLTLLLQWLLLQWLLQSWRLAGSVPAVAEGMASGSPLLRLAGPPAAILALPLWRWEDLSSVGLRLMLAQTLLTALLAPLLCSLLLLLWRQLGAAPRSGL
ncbi:MAG: rod shape-determining protein MreD [Cyanobium sp.]